MGQTRWGAGNAEVVGYTELVNDSRHDARQQLEKDVRRMGGEGVVVSRMDMRVHERECPMQEHGKDHIVEVTIVGTATVRFAARGQAATAAGHDVSRPAAPPGRAGPAGTLTGQPCSTNPQVRRAMTDQQSTELSVEGVPQDAMRRLAELRPGRPGPSSPPTCR